MEQFVELQIYVKDGDGEYAETVTTDFTFDMYRVEGFYRTLDKDNPVVIMQSGDEFQPVISYDEFKALHAKYQKPKFIMGNG